MQRLLALPLLFGLVLIPAACAYKPGIPTQALDGSQSGVVYFSSTDNYDFSRGDPAIPLVIDGNLRFPQSHNGAVFILSHGSGGWRARHEGWAEFLRSHGYATFSLNHFGPRNVLSTIHGQVRVTEQQMALDVIHAAELLSSDPRIQPNKIFHMGWSKGASAGLMAAIESTGGDTDNAIQPPIAGYIGFYPYCGIVGEVSSSARILLMHGSDDDYTLLTACERLTDLMRASGTDMTLKVFDGAHHGFDSWNTQLTSRPSSITVRDMSDKCTLVYSRTAPTRSVDGNFSVESFDSRIDFLRACGVRGVHVGGSPKYRDAVEKLVLQFATPS